jgi:hypothetical protein
MKTWIVKQPACILKSSAIFYKALKSFLELASSWAWRIFDLKMKIREEKNFFAKKLLDAKIIYQ